MINSHFYTPTSVFFDPWIDLDYYFTVLPILPLVFDRIFIYYPSDHWIESTHYLSPSGREHYRRAMLYCLSRGIIVPVVKGDYPFDNEIGGARLKNDNPTDLFRSKLRKNREANEKDWIILPPGSTERGRQSATEIVHYIGKKDLLHALLVKADPKAIPELAYYYSGGKQATKERALIETIGTYENDEWIRSENRLGEYLLPSVMAYQYRSLYEMHKQNEVYDIKHYAAVASALDQYSEQKLGLIIGEWPEQQKMDQWRELGLHRVLRAFLAAEASPRVSNNNEIVDNSAIFSERLNELRSQLPVKIALELIDNKILWNLLLISSGVVSGFVTSGILGAAFGLAGSVVVGQVGDRVIRFGLRKIRWDLFLEYVSDVIGHKQGRKLEQFALGFGDVTVFGPR